MDLLYTPALWTGAGALAAVVIMLLLGLLRRAAARRRTARRDRIITSVQEKWTDVDSAIVAYRAGQISTESFRSALLDKIEAVNRTYKPGMHLLDIFFVKYTEKLIEEFTRAAETGVVETVQRETVSLSSARHAEVFEKTPKKAPEPESTASAAVPETVQTLQKPEISLEEEPQLSDDAVADAIAEVSSKEEELPVETFLEPVPESEEIKEPAEKTAESEEKKEEEAPLPEISEKNEGPSVSAAPEAPPAPSETSGKPVKDKFAEETITSRTAVSFTLADRVSGAAPSPYSEAPESGEPSIAVPESGKEDEETMVEAAVSIPVKITEEPVKEPEKPETPSAAAPSLPQEGREETVQQPSAMDDIEAETIIADRSELLGTGKETEQKSQGDKSQIGITGDDVSDMLDQFFGGKS